MYGNPWENVNSSIINIIIENGITGIGNWLFYRCVNATNITLPNSITSLGDHAFAYCTSIMNIQIPNGVTEIKDSTFDGCSSLTSINLPNSITAVGESAFYGCTSLSNITLPPNLTSIGRCAFKNCSKLSDITIPSGVKIIEEETFCNCSRLASITIPNNVENIGDNVFKYCETLENIDVATGNEYYTSDNGILFNKNKTILLQYPAKKKISAYTVPTTVTEIKDGAFCLCSNLKEIIIPSGVTRIGDGTFTSCNNLKKISLPNSITYIGQEAFYYCGKLNQINIPSNLKYIGKYAFQNCSSIETMSFPATLNEIDEEALSFLSSLSSINVNSANQTFTTEDGVLFTKNMEKLILYPAKKANETYTIPSQVKMISAYAFANNKNIKQLSYTNNQITDIGKYAFYNCSELKNGIISSSLINIGERAYGNCKKLESMEIKENVEKIGDLAFVNCEQLTSIDVVEENEHFKSNNGVLFDKEGKKLLAYPCNKAGTTYNIPSGTEEILKYAFTGNKNIVNIEIGENISKIGQSAFENSKKLEAFYVTEDNNYFANDDGVLYTKDKSELICYPVEKANTQYTIPTTVKKIHTSAFYGCTKLQNINMANSIEQIDRYAFYNCNSLKSITLPTNLKTINTYTFGYCTNLKNVNFNQKVTEIGTAAFYKCNNLTQITIPESVKVIKNHAFNSCEKILSITIPQNTETIEEYAFGNCKNLTSISVNSNNQKYSSVDGVLFDKNQETLICYPAGKQNLTYNVLENTTAIESGAFYKNQKLNDIRLSEDIELLGTDVFVRGKSGTSAQSNSINYGLIFDVENHTYYLIDQMMEEIEEENTPMADTQSEGGDNNNNEIGTETNNSDEGKYNVYYYPDNQEVTKYITDNPNEANYIDITSIAPQISSISIKTKPTKIKYKKGETLDLSGLVILVTYDDGSTQDITEGYTSNPANGATLTTVGTQTVRITYEGKTTSFNVTVSEQVVTLSQISIKTRPTKTTYKIGERLDLSGLVILATYSNGTTQDITEGYTSNPENGTILSTAGRQAVVITYEGKTTQFSVMVNEENSDNIFTEESTYEEDGTYVENVLLQTSIADFLSNFNNEYTVTVSNENAEYIGTGMIVTIKKSENIVSTLEVVIMGDVTGDGIANISDIFDINKVRLNTLTLEGAKEKAANMNKDSVIDFLDILEVNKLRKF